jgi:hypothetical protein
LGLASPDHEGGSTLLIAIPTGAEAVMLWLMIHPLAMPRKLITANRPAIEHPLSKAEVGQVFDFLYCEVFPSA